MQRNTFLLKSAAFLRGLVFYVPIVTLYFVDHKVALPSIVISQVLYSLFSFLGEVPTGLIADKFGKKRAVVLGYAIGAVGFILMFGLANTAGLLLTYSILGLSDAFLSGSEEALMYESITERRSFQKQYGSLLSNEIIGFAISTFIVGVAVQHYGAASYRPFIGFTVVAYILATLLVTKLVNIKNRVDEQGRTSSWQLAKQSLAHIRYHPTIATLTQVSLLTLTSEWVLYGVYQPYFQDYHVAPFFLGFVLSTGAVLNFVLMKYSYVLERFLSLEKILLLINVAIGLLWLSFAVLVSPIFLVLSFILMKGLFNTQQPIVSDYVNGHTGSEIRATVLSGMSLFRSLGQLSLRLVLALLIATIGLRKTFVFQAIYMLVGISLSHWLLVRCGCTRKVRHHEEAVVSQEKSVV